MTYNEQRYKEALGRILELARNSKTANMIYVIAADALCPPQEPDAPLKYVAEILPHQDRVIIDGCFYSVSTIKNLIKNNPCLCGPKEPEFEEHQLVRWECPSCAWSAKHFTIACPNGHGELCELKGTYRRPVKKVPTTCKHCGATNG